MKSYRVRKINQADGINVEAISAVNAAYAWARMESLGAKVGDIVLVDDYEKKRTYQFVLQLVATEINSRRLQPPLEQVTYGGAL